MSRNRSPFSWCGRLLYVLISQKFTSTNILNPLNEMLLLNHWQKLPTSVELSKMVAFVKSRSRQNNLLLESWWLTVLGMILCESWFLLIFWVWTQINVVLSLLYWWLPLASGGLPERPMPSKVMNMVDGYLDCWLVLLMTSIISPLLSACVHLCSEVFILSICSLGTIGGIVGVGWKRWNSSFHD